MTGWVLASWVGCAGDATGPPLDSAVEPLAPLVIDPGPAEAGRSAIPCPGVHLVSIRNQDTVEHRVDAVSFAPTLGEVRLDPWDVAVPQVVRPGAAMEVPLRDDGAEPGPTAGTLTVESDVGTLTAEVVGERTWGEPHAATFTVPEPLVDVVLAVDQSGNMPDDHAADFAAGVGGWLDALSAAAHWRLILVHTEDGCADGGIYADGDRGVAQALGRDAFSGAPHPLDEHLLELASRALAENAPTECNAGFRRDDAQLAVVVVSDEPEQSGRPASFWVDDFRAYADVVTVSGILDVARRCNGGAGGYADAVDATGGVALDLCTGDWPDRMPTLVDALVPVPPSFPLEGGAIADSIEARIGGRRVDATWDADTGLLTLGAAPPAGTTVDVTWSAPAACDDGR